MASAPAVSLPPLTTSTNLGALPTSISFPASCVDNLYDFNTKGLGLPWTYETQGCALSTCCPCGNVYTEGFAWYTSYYSPGVCPSDYKSCSLPNGLTPTLSETIVFCCLSSHTCPGTDGFFCQSGLARTLTPPVTVLDNIYDQAVVSTRPYEPTFSGGVSYQIAYPIQIRFREDELTTSGTDTFVRPDALQTTSRTESPPGDGEAPASSSTEAASPALAPDDSGMSTGTKIGLGLGIGLGIPILAIAAFAAIRMGLFRKRNHTSYAFSPSTHPDSGEYTLPLGSNPDHTPSEKELRDRQQYILPQQPSQARQTQPPAGMRWALVQDEPQQIIPRGHSVPPPYQ